MGRRVDGLDGVSRAEPRQHVPGDRRRRVQVIARDDDGTAAIAFHLIHVHQRAQRDHLAPVIPDLEQVQGLDPVAVVALGLDSDLPVAAELVEAVDVQRAQEHRQRLIHVLERDSQGDRLGPVDVQLDRRRVGPEPGRNVGQTGLVRSLAGQEVGLGLQVGESTAAAVLDHDLEPARNTQARDRRGIAHAHDRILDPLPVLGYQPGHDVIGVQSQRSQIENRRQGLDDLALLAPESS